MMKALIADDHPLFRNALKQALGGVFGEQLFESADFESTLATLSANDDI
ncbi:MAG: DNA-binding response regulator, partial [Glaciecola sp.]